MRKLLTSRLAAGFALVGTGAAVVASHLVPQVQAMSDGPVHAVSIAAYIAASVWWLWRCVLRTSPMWPNLVLVWAPAILPVVWLAQAGLAMGEHDSAALAFLVAIGPAVAACVASGIAAFIVFDRLAFPARGTGQE